jgi:outer membrane protein OmpA-like peptidoglycan-associated protein
MVQMHGDRIDLLRTIDFVPDGYDLMPGMGSVLDEVRGIMAVDARMRIRVAVRGHAAGRGRRPGADLGMARAQAIEGWLVEHGIDEARVELAALPGAGEPTVEITILDRTPEPEEE